MLNLIRYGKKDFEWTLCVGKNIHGLYVFRTIKIKPRRKETKEYWISPYRYLKYYVARFKWHITHFYLWITKQLHRKCHGCGEGIIAWRIKDPNEKFETKKRWLVCDGCVSFYDWHWSRKPAVMKVKRK